MSGPERPEKSSRDDPLWEADFDWVEVPRAPEPDAAATAHPDPSTAGEPERPLGTAASNRRRIAVSTAFFSAATGLSRVAGLVREVVAASLFGVSAAMSAFTIAFMVPNLVRSLFADAAIQAAFVPVFTELLEKGQRREAFRLASTMIYLVGLVLGVLTLFFVLVAPLVIPLFAPGFDGANEQLVIVLSQFLFPILVLLGLTGMVAGILNSYDRFGAFAISPLFWNIAIIVVLAAATPLFEGRDQIYAYAIGVLVGTVIQLAINAFDLRRTPFRPQWVFDWRSPTVRRVLVLMLPVTISLGLINFNLAINAIFGSLVSEEAPAAIDKAFRIYMLPQGIFSVAIATVLFPTLARFAARDQLDDLRETMASGMRQIVLLLVPAMAVMLVLAEPITRLLYQRGVFDAGDTELVATALFWFAFSLPFNGLFLLLTRTFFSLQRPWVPTAISVGNLAITAIAALLLYESAGIAGIVAATVIATAASVAAQAWVLRGELGRLELGALLAATLKVGVAAAALAGAAYLVWFGLDSLLGRALLAQVASLGVALAVGIAVFVAAVTALRVREAAQIIALVRSRPGGA
ncbi:MAG: murein biosynthesis integral membrane protein MurJ [Solirubrobacterales bacterium]|nr:murein biosynthesis integral membrane protein MurJ [Solirubrobacterales bacterium]